MKLATEAPVNGGRNYDGPKVVLMLPAHEVTHGAILGCMRESPLEPDLRLPAMIPSAGVTMVRDWTIRRKPGWL